MRMKLWHAIALIVVVWAGLYLPYLGSREIHGEEARRILPARTMLENGDWIVPRIAGEEYSRKPPLINWSIASAIVLTGVDNEFSARLPSVLWLLAFGVVAAWALSPRLGVWRAACVPLFMLTTIAMLDKGRMAEIEAMYVAQTGIAFVLWARWWAEGRNWLAWTIPWLVLGVGLLAKGPIHLLFFYPVVVATLIRARRIKELISPAHLLGIVLMIAVFAPWAWLNLSRVQDAGASSGVWSQQLLARIFPANLDWGRWAIRPVQVLADFLPWTPILIWAWIKTRAELKTAEHTDRWTCVIRGSQTGILIGYAIVLLAPEGLPRYAQPLFPMIAVLLVDLIGRIDRKSIAKVEGWWRVGNVALPTIGILAAVIILFVAPKFGLPASIGGTAAACGFALVALGYNLKVTGPHPLIGTTVSLIALIFAFHILAGPIFRADEFFRPAAKLVEQAAPETDGRIVFFDTKYLPFLYYVRNPRVEVPDSKTLRTLEGKFRYLVIRPKDRKDKTKPDVRAVLENAEKTGEFKWGKQNYEVYDRGEEF
ncbi:MAG: 4-amino-4-deoxy-L-arabinose transferase-like glycosyltransferase [Verrucomicrobiales bacterium]|jgi:4-amino-4-deoxy-L-arabinose transferase-like glycosyltransferase